MTTSASVSASPVASVGVQPRRAPAASADRAFGAVGTGRRADSSIGAAGRVSTPGSVSHPGRLRFRRDGDEKEYQKRDEA